MTVMKDIHLFVNFLENVQAKLELGAPFLVTLKKVVVLKGHIESNIFGFCHQTSQVHEIKINSPR